MTSLTIPEFHRVSDRDIEAPIDGQRLYYSADVSLVTSSDALACAFWLPAMASGRPLVSDSAIDELLHGNLLQIRSIAAQWWNFPEVDLIAPTVRRESNGTGVGLFFTCGVDSMFTLLRNIDHVDHLINVHGFDIRLDDGARFKKQKESILRVAELTKKTSIFVETNLKEHPAFSWMSWEIAHIAALISVGSLLTDHLDRIYVASTDIPPPWGSHADLDPLWGSSALKVVNNEKGLSRLDKVLTISDWPVAHDNLKVCWENKRETLNCGICEKCLRTMTQIEVSGTLDKFSVFPPGRLADRIAALPRTTRAMFKQWTDTREAIDNKRIRVEIDKLLNRSGRDKSIGNWLAFHRRKFQQRVKDKIYREFASRNPVN